jgi:predicted transcriptional regulator
MPHRNNNALHPNARLVLYQIHQHHGLGVIRPRDLKQWTGLSLSQVAFSLRALRERGLVASPSYGHWAATRAPMDIAWIEQAIARCDATVTGMADDDPLSVELTLAKHHLAAALAKARL